MKPYTGDNWKNRDEVTDAQGRLINGIVTDAYENEKALNKIWRILPRTMFINQYFPFLQEAY